MIHLSHSPHPVSHPKHAPNVDIFGPLRRGINQIEIRNRPLARLICRLIPNACPFERDVTFFGHTVHIPALCELNPLYPELVDLRFRALTYLVDVCGEDIIP